MFPDNSYLLFYCDCRHSKFIDRKGNYIPTLAHYIFNTILVFIYAERHQPR